MPFMTQEQINWACDTIGDLLREWKRLHDENESLKREIQQYKEKEMTWGARILKADGTAKDGDYQACQSCKHGQYDFQTDDPNWKKIQPCYLPKVAAQIGSILTCVDISAAGHMASGQANLLCNGYEPIAEPETEPDH
jgi:cell division septum initiation protein DivIVA